MTSWVCPYCNRPTTVTTPNRDGRFIRININGDKLVYDERVGLTYDAIACPNEDCKQLYLSVSLDEEDYYPSGAYYGSETHHVWQLLPESSAKPQPEYIPKQIVEDYTEACRIKDLSPKASATLSRRCLQGIIRDFWGVKKGTLKEEIDGLEDKLSSPEREAIDAVRSVGNIGAHMEKDVNIIVDVKAEEAELLISLIEDLFETWYVARHEREERQKKLKALAESKKAEKKQAKKETT